ncbi:DUF4124 domain-containing protein, partial [Photobacterium sanctipauli]
MNCVCKLTLATLLAFTTTSQADTIYTWEDEDGTVHFSDRPQPGAAELKLNVPEPAPPAQTT